MSPKRLRAGRRVDTRVRRVASDGLGRATVRDGSRELELVIEDGLTGEEGTAILTHVGARRAFGRLVERQASSSERRRSLPCARWTAASPCRVMHLTDEAQRDFKRRRVHEALTRAGLQDLEVDDVVPSNDRLGWRARSIYVVARPRGRVVLGAYRRGTHIVQDMGRCPLEETSVARAARAVAEALDEKRVAVANPRLEVVADGGCGGPLELEGPARRVSRSSPGSPELTPGGVRYVVIRCDSEGLADVTLLTFGGELAGTAEIAAAARRRFEGLVGFYVGPSGDGDVVFGRSAPVAVGEATPLVERIGDLELEVSPGAFFQVHRAAARGLRDWVLGQVRGRRVVDVYCGVGALALGLARIGSTVLGIESSPIATADAERNARRSGLAGATEFVCDDAARALAALAGATEPWDSIVLNPPRKGCDEAVLDAIERLASRRVVYVSCNPDSLARDLARLGRAYDVVSVRPFDLFPHSEHVEVVATLERG